MHNRAVIKVKLVPEVKLVYLKTEDIWPPGIGATSEEEFRFPTLIFPLISHFVDLSERISGRGCSAFCLVVVARRLFIVVSLAF